MIRFSTEGPGIQSTITAISSDGKDMIMSASRMMTWLTRGPAWPATSPNADPMSAENSTAPAATVMVFRVATMIRASRGRPSASAPMIHSQPRSHSKGGHCGRAGSASVPRIQP